MILAPPTFNLPIDIAEIPSIRVDESNRDAILFALEQLLIAPYSRPPQLPFPVPEPRLGKPIGHLADEILEQLEDQMTESEIIRLLALVFQTSKLSHVLETPVYNFAEPDAQKEILDTRKRAYADLVVWSDDFDQWIGNPVIIVVKRSLNVVQWREALGQVTRYLQISHTRSAFILYLNATSSARHEISSYNLSNIFVMNIRQFINELRTKSFTQIMNALRNRTVHGIDIL